MDTVSTFVVSDVPLATGGPQDPGPGDVVIGFKVHCGLSAPGFDGLDDPRLVRLSFGLYPLPLVGPPAPGHPTYPGAPGHPTPPGEAPVPEPTPDPIIGPPKPPDWEGGSWTHDGITYVDTVVHGKTSGTTGIGAKLGDDSGDVAGRIKKQIDAAVDRGDLPPDRVDVQHNGQPDANGGGGAGRLIVRQPSHIDAQCNDGKLGLYIVSVHARLKKGGLAHPTTRRRDAKFTLVFTPKGDASTPGRRVPNPVTPRSVRKNWGPRAEVKVGEPGGEPEWAMNTVAGDWGPPPEPKKRYDALSPGAKMRAPYHGEFKLRHRFDRPGRPGQSGGGAGVFVFQDWAGASKALVVDFDVRVSSPEEQAREVFRTFWRAGIRVECIGLSGVRVLDNQWLGRIAYWGIYLRPNLEGPAFPWTLVMEEDDAWLWHDLEPRPKGLVPAQILVPNPAIGSAIANQAHAPLAVRHSEWY